jgi:hypothetical protein
MTLGQGGSRLNSPIIRMAWLSWPSTCAQLLHESSSAYLCLSSLDLPLIVELCQSFPSNAPAVPPALWVFSHSTLSTRQGGEIWEIYLDRPVAVGVGEDLAERIHIGIISVSDPDPAYGRCNCSVRLKSYHSLAPHSPHHIKSPTELKRVRRVLAGLGYLPMVMYSVAGLPWDPGRADTNPPSIFVNTQLATEQYLGTKDTSTCLQLQPNQSKTKTFSSTLPLPHHLHPDLRSYPRHHLSKYLRSIHNEYAAVNRGHQSRPAPKPLKPAASRLTS